MTKIPLLEKLAAQSLVYVDTGLDDGPELIFSKERFAELIVRECAGVELYWLSEQDRKSVAEKIREHFGVEEWTNEIGLYVYGTVILLMNFNDMVPTNRLETVLLDCHLHTFGV